MASFPKPGPSPDGPPPYGASSIPSGIVRSDLEDPDSLSSEWETEDEDDFIEDPPRQSVLRVETTKLPIPTEMVLKLVASYSLRKGFLAPQPQ